MKNLKALRDKRYYQNHKDKLKKVSRIRYYQQIKDYPWKRFLDYIKRRCTNPNVESYSRYGGKGIKCFLNYDKLKELWFRDKAYLLKNPSIHRKNSNGNYEFNNCEFIEMKANISEASSRKVLQFDLNGKLIGEFKNIYQASKKTKISYSFINISARNMEVNNCIWKFANVKGNHD